MTLYEFEQAKRARRRDMMIIAIAVVGIFLAVKMPPPISAPEGPGYETCMTRGC